jgi:hypothetical protein
MAVLRTAGRLAVAALLVLQVAMADGAAATSITEAQVKAALLYNFATFVEWPASLEPGQPLVVGVAGDDQVAAAVRELPALSDGRPLEVRVIGDAQDPAECRVLYVAALSERATAALLARLGRAPVLTVGEQEHFTQLGGMIRLFPERGRLHFEVHLGHATAARLHISSRVLRLASLVRDADGL